MYEKALANLAKGDFVLKDGELQWLSPDVLPPTEEEIQAEIKRLEVEEPINKIKEIRASAYAAEADPLFFKYQRGEATKEEWETKIEEIRQRYPYPF